MKLKIDHIKTLTFLIHDQRWVNLRSYFFDTLDNPQDDTHDKNTTFIFGIIISLVCPELFRLQNILFGLIVTNGNVSFKTLMKITKSTGEQLVIIHDTFLYDTKPRKRFSFVQKCLKLTVGYLAYVLPVFIMLMALLYGQSDKTICRELNARFLLDNNVEPAVNLTKMYEDRRGSRRIV